MSDTDIHTNVMILDGPARGLELNIVKPEGERLAPTLRVHELRDEPGDFEVKDPRNGPYPDPVTTRTYLYGYAVGEDILSDVRYADYRLIGEDLVSQVYTPLTKSIEFQLLTEAFTKMIEAAIPCFVELAEAASDTAQDIVAFSDQLQHPRDKQGRFDRVQREPTHWDAFVDLLRDAREWIYRGIGKA